MRSRIEARIPPLGLAQAERATSVRWRNFDVVFLITLINLVDRISLSIAMPTIAKEFALSPAMQELILSSFFWSYAPLQIPGSRLIDRFRPRRVVAAATVLWGVFQTLLRVASGGLSMLLLRVGLDGAEAPLFPAGSRLNALWLSCHERARGLSLQQIGTSTFFIFLCDALCSRGWTRGKVVKGMITLSGLTTLGVLAALPSISSAVEAVVVLCAAADVGQPLLESAVAARMPAARRSAGRAARGV
jgi:MFS family permease